MNFRKKLLVTCLLLSLASLLRAEPVSQLKPTGYVNDFAHVLSPTTVTQINNLAQEVDQKAHAQIALVTLNTLDDRDIESYAVDLYKQWGIGQKGTDRGVLILYAIKDRRSRIEVGYGLEPILPDGKVGSFQREAIPLMRSGDYNGALSLVTRRVADVIATDAGVQLAGASPSAPAGTDKDSGESPLSFGILFFVLLMVFFILKRILSPLRSRRRGGWWGGPGLGGGFGGFGGGSWGGGGGGGFGGFGGGSSGGGGASSGW